MQFVPSGILLYRSPLALFSGGTSYNPARWQYDSSSVGSLQKFKELHRIFYHASADSTMFGFNPINFDDSLYVAIYGSVRTGLTGQQQLELTPKADVVLGILHVGSYHHISLEAWDSLYIRYDSNDSLYKLNIGYIHVYDTVFLDLTFTVMKTKIYFKGLFVLFFIATATLKAQNLDSLKARYNLLTPWVSSRILYDRNPQNMIWAGSVFNSVNYDGTRDSLCSKAAFSELHETKYHEAFDTTLLKFNPVYLDRLINNALYETDVSGWTTAQFMSTPAPNNAVLGFMDLDFQAISPFANDNFKSMP